MIIGIDANEANLSNRVGVGQYAFHILNHLYHQDHHNRYYIYLKNPPLSDFPAPKPNWRYFVFGPQKIWTKFALPVKLYTQFTKPNLFFSPSHYSPHFSPIPTIPTIHDLGYLKYNQQFTSKDLYQLKNWTKHSILMAAHIVTVSHFTKNEVIKTYGIDRNKISVIKNGVSPPLSLPSNSDFIHLSKKLHLQRPYFLYLGTLKPSKNIPFLLNAYSEFLKTYSEHQSLIMPKLVIAGKKGWLYNDIYQSVSHYQLNNQVVFTDYITESEKWLLYLNAICTILPSLYEGFGIPAIESMSVGTPVLVSDIPPLKEVVGKSGLYFNPQKLPELISQLHSILNPKTRLTISNLSPTQAKKFTWESSAKKLIKVFSKFNPITHI